MHLVKRQSVRTFAEASLPDTVWSGSERDELGTTCLQWGVYVLMHANSTADK